MDKALQTMISNMPEKTGKPLEDWLKILQEKSFNKHSEGVKFLKEEYGITHGFANTIVHLSRQQPAGQAGDPVENQYNGKEDLKPFYEKLKMIIESFGTDIEFAPKKAYVSVRRKKQFAIIQPSTRSRLDLGLNIKGRDPEGKLEASGSFNAMCSHRVRIEKAEDISPDVINWIREAYEEAG